MSSLPTTGNPIVDAEMRGATVTDRGITFSPPSGDNPFLKVSQDGTADPLTAVYDRYAHLDALLSDPGDTFDRAVLADLWRAIKTAVTHKECDE